MLFRPSQLTAHWIGRIYGIRQLQAVSDILFITFQRNNNLCKFAHFYGFVINFDVVLTVHRR